jgi:group I intron endonuclease
MNFGIYAIRNIVNGRRYIGSTGKLSERWGQHRRELNRGTHFNSYLQNAWNKYGENSFAYEIVEECSSSALMNKEEYWIKNLQSYKDENGYNLCRTPRASRLGCKASPETIAKMKVSMGGKNHPNWGRKLSSQHVANMSKAMTGILKPNSGVKKKYTVINPDGMVVEVIGLRKFCRDNNLIHSMFWRVVTGKQKEYRGWRSFMGWVPLRGNPRTGCEGDASLKQYV